MTSGMDAEAAKKRAKNRINLLLRDSKPGDAISHERLRELFLKTQEMGSMSQMKNRQMGVQFEELDRRLSTSSSYLDQIKTSIEKIKIGYERDIFDLEKVTDESRADIDRKIMEIRAQIGKLRSEADKPKPQALTYQDAFNNVIDAFKSVAQNEH